MKKFSLFLISALLLCACHSETQTNNRYSKTSIDAGFDTAITLHGYCESEDEFNDYFTLATNTFKSYHELFDAFHTYEKPNLKTINDNAGKEAVVVDKELYHVIALSKEYYTITNGKFDISQGTVLSLWHDARTDALNDKPTWIPSVESLKEASTHTGFDKVVLDETNHSVYLSDPNTSLDLGAIAKGYATEQTAKKLKEAGLKSGILDAGGNVRLIGKKADGNWNVGIQIPDEETKTSIALLQVSLKDETSFVTSGDYQRYFTHNSKNYHHIIDPSTLFPSTYVRSVTVITKDSTLADMLSTALFTMSYEDGLDLINQLNEKGNQIDAIWIFDETTPAPNGVDTVSVDSYEVIATEGITSAIQYQ